QSLVRTRSVQRHRPNPSRSSVPPTSAASSAALLVTPPPPGNTSPPTISGTAQQGQTLTESHGSWTNEPTSYTYQWQQCDSAGANCSAITGATSQTYVPVAEDIGHTIRVRETQLYARVSSSPATSAQSAVPTP